MKMHARTKNAQNTPDRLNTEAKASIEPPKFCVNCHWHSFKEVTKKDRFDYMHFCTFPPLLDVITGKPSNPAKNRNDATLCGKNAKHFANKQRG